MWAEIATAAAGGAATLGSYLESRKLRQFQEDMSNTAYRRSVEDMRAAGLNPALMFGSGGPASTPQGGNGADFGPLAKGVASAARMAFERRSQDADVALKEKQGELTDAQRLKTEQDTATGSAQEEKTRAERSLVEAQTASTSASARATEARLPVLELEAQFWKRIAPYANEVMRGVDSWIRSLKPGAGIPSTDEIIGGVSSKLSGKAKEAFEQSLSDAKNSGRDVWEMLQDTVRHVFPVHKPGEAGRGRSGATGNW